MQVFRLCILAVHIIGPEQDITAGAREELRAFFSEVARAIRSPSSAACPDLCRSAEEVLWRIHQIERHFPLNVVHQADVWHRFADYDHFNLQFGSVSERALSYKTWLDAFDSDASLFPDNLIASLQSLTKASYSPSYHPTDSETPWRARRLKDLDLRQ